MFISQINASLTSVPSQKYSCSQGLIYGTPRLLVPCIRLAKSMSPLLPSRPLLVNLQCLVLVKGCSSNLLLASYYKKGYVNLREQGSRKSPISAPLIEPRCASLEFKIVTSGRAASARPLQASGVRCGLRTGTAGLQVSQRRGYRSRPGRATLRCATGANRVPSPLRS